MQYNKKATAQKVLQQILRKGPLDKEHIKKTIIKIGAQAAVRFLHYHSMKSLYSLRKI